MGRKQTFICRSCNYNVVTSAGADVGFSSKSNTFVCFNCKILVDFYDPKIKKHKNETIKAGNKTQSCPKCGGNNLELWDSVNKPCPKCGDRLDVDPEGLTILWD